MITEIKEKNTRAASFVEGKADLPKLYGEPDKPVNPDLDTGGLKEEERRALNRTIVKKRECADSWSKQSHPSNEDLSGMEHPEDSTKRAGGKRGGKGKRFSINPF